MCAPGPRLAGAPSVPGLTSQRHVSTAVSPPPGEPRRRQAERRGRPSPAAAKVVRPGLDPVLTRKDKTPRPTRCPSAAATPTHAGRLSRRAHTAVASRAARRGSAADACSRPLRASSRPRRSPGHSAGASRSAPPPLPPCSQGVPGLLRRHSGARRRATADPANRRSRVAPARSQRTSGRSPPAAFLNRSSRNSKRRAQ